VGVLAEIRSTELTLVDEETDALISSSAFLDTDLT
jgi:hypothetical protein